MATSLQFRPRSIDVNLPLRILHAEDESELEELDQNSSLFTPVTPYKRKTNQPPLEEEVRPIAIEDDGKPVVPIPGVRIVHNEVETPDERPSKRSKKNTSFQLPQHMIKYQDTHKTQRQQAEYDMDGEDEDFLWVLNSNNSAGKSCKLTADLFEIMIEIFEVELYRVKFANETNELFSFPTKKKTNNNNHHNSDKMEVDDEDNEELVCDVCSGTTTENDNPILFCDNCHVSVHKQCYQVKTIPPKKGGWQCQYCKATPSTRKNIKCALCSNYHSNNNTSYNNNHPAYSQSIDRKWMHSSCAMGVSGIAPKAVSSQSHNITVSQIPKYLWNNVCKICKKKEGVCMECSYESCDVTLHVTCAKQQGLYVGLDDSEPSNLMLYCRKHSLQYELTKENPFDCDSLDEDQLQELEDTVTSYQQTFPLLLKHQQRVLFSSRIAQLYYYWRSRKRADMVGSNSILRRFQLQLKPEFDLRQEYNMDNVEYRRRLKLLRKDLETARLLIDQCRKRELYKKDQVKFLESLVNLQFLQTHMEIEEELKQEAEEEKQRQREAEAARKAKKNSKNNQTNNNKKQQKNTNSNNNKHNIHNNNHHTSSKRKQQPATVVIVEDDEEEEEEEDSEKEEDEIIIIDDDEGEQEEQTSPIIRSPPNRRRGNKPAPKKARIAYHHHHVSSPPSSAEELHSSEEEEEEIAETKPQISNNHRKSPMREPSPKRNVQHANNKKVSTPTPRKLIKSPSLTNSRQGVALRNKKQAQ